MNTLLLHPSAARTPLGLALGASLGLHLVALAWQIQGPHPESPARPLEVVLHLQAPATTPASPPTLASPPVPRAVEAPPQAHPRVQPQTPPLAQDILSRPTAPARVSPAPPVAPATPAPMHAVQAVQPTAPAATPSSTPLAQAASVTPTTPAAHGNDAAPAPEAPADPAALERYGRSLADLLAQQQQYPRMAAMRGWEGEVRLRITIARKGNIVATDVIRSSGHELLDRSAIQLVTQAGPLPRLPEALQNREIQLIVPVHYRLEKSS